MKLGGGLSVYSQQSDLSGDSFVSVLVAGRSGTVSSSMAAF